MVKSLSKTTRLTTMCALFLATTSYTYSQQTDVWKTSGNEASSTDFIGTVNEKPVIFKSGGSEVFRLTPQGQLGIGTSTPQAMLHVNGETVLRGAVALPQLGQMEPTNNYDIVFIDEGGVLKTGSIAAFEDIIYEPIMCPPGDISSPKWSNGVNKLYSLCPQVLVGINTSDPRVHLDVIGTSYAERTALGGDPNSFISERLKITGYSAASSADLISVANTSETFYTLSNQGKMNLKGQFVLTSFDSKPLIVNSSTEKILQLESDGLLRVRRLKIDHDTWADYVFDENYTLMPLAEVKTYIEQNHHLPEIPSTNEVQEEGLDVGQMNELLLKKVEELTLYVIQQQEQIESLKKKIEEK